MHERQAGTPRHSRWRDHLRRAGAALRALLGAPDYERYLLHVRERHPGETPLSRDEFVRRRLEDRYARPGSRCC